MLALPAAAVAYGVYRLMSTYDESLQELESAKQNIKRQMPITGQYQSPDKVAQSTGGKPRRILEDLDLRGVPIWHVDYGNGALHTSYAPPHVTHSPTFY